MNKQLLCVVLFCIAATVNVQAQKIGFTNVQGILALMPESKQIDSELQAYERQLTNKLSATRQGFQSQLQQYQQNSANMTAEARQAREKELRDLQATIQQEQAEAQANLRRKEQELLNPALKKIEATIKKVAKANGYTHILTQEAFLFIEDEENANITDMVLKEMGITPPER